MGFPIYNCSAARAKDFLIEMSFVQGRGIKKWDDQRFMLKSQDGVKGSEEMRGLF